VVYLSPVPLVSSLHHILPHPTFVHTSCFAFFKCTKILAREAPRYSSRQLSLTRHFSGWLFKTSTETHFFACHPLVAASFLRLVIILVFSTGCMALCGAVRRNRVWNNILNAWGWQNNTKTGKGDLYRVCCLHPGPFWGLETIFNLCMFWKLFYFDFYSTVMDTISDLPDVL
jgi:hypothetical protein